MQRQFQPFREAFGRQAYTTSTKNMRTWFTFIIGFALAFTSFGGSTDQTTWPELLLSRTYYVSTNNFMAHLKHLLPAKAGETDSELVARFFKQKHVDIKPPEAMFFNDKKGLLYVRATQAHQDKIEKLIEKIVLGKDVPVS